MLRYEDDLGWNAGARSVAVEPGDCTSTFKPSPNCIGVIVGFNSVDTGVSINDIQHGFYFRRYQGSQVYTVFEKGLSKTAPATYVDADVFHVTRNGGVVKYWVNSTVVYTSSTPSTGAVFLDTALYSTGDSVL